MFQVLSLHKAKVIAVFVSIILLQVATYWGVSHLEKRQIAQDYTSYAKQMRQQIQQSIHAKQQATTAIAFTLSSQFTNNTSLNRQLLSEKRFGEIIRKVNEFSEYKNLWVQVVDPQGHSLYRSWSKAKDSPRKVRPEFAIIEHTNQPMQTVTSGFFDISIKSIVPIAHQGKLLGFIDLISHFNSIQLLFQKHDIETLVVATAERSALIKYPFGTHTIGEHYVSNLNPNKTLLKQLTPALLQQWQTTPYALWKDYLIVALPLIAPDNNIHGYLYSFSPLSLIQSKSPTKITPDQAAYSGGFERRFRFYLNT